MLEAIVRDCCEGVGLTPADASMVADVLVYANLRGQDAHGFIRIANYMQRVRAGLAGGSDRLVVLGEHGALRRVDARQAIGPAAAVRATDLATEVAKADGVGIVGLCNATHFGAAGFYARRATDRGLISLVLSNGPSWVAPHGAAEPLFGTNPLAIGVPGRNGAVVLDMATSAIARGRVRDAAARGEELPPGTAIDAAGRPTTDPDAALAGNLLAFGGAKGSGLALVVSLLAMAIAGAEPDDDMRRVDTAGGSSRFSMFKGSVGQVFVAIDPHPLTGDAGQEAVEAFVDRLRGSKPATGVDAVRAPGERGNAIAAARAAEGIPVSDGDLAEVAGTCRELGLDEIAERLERLGS